MLEVLESVGSFPHRVLPTRIFEGDIGRSLAEGDRRFDEQGNFKPEFYTDDYVLLQMTEHLDAMDLERSVYKRYDPETSSVSGLRKPIFKDIGQDYPPIFRCIHSPVSLYVSDQARQALEVSRVKGLRLFNHETGYILLS